jgi:hypothetical protein
MVAHGRSSWFQRVAEDAQLAGDGARHTIELDGDSFSFKPARTIADSRALEAVAKKGRCENLAFPAILKGTVPFFARASYYPLVQPYQLMLRDSIP